jgi:hypoxanthine phosphoribosyltransferase
MPAEVVLSGWPRTSTKSTGNVISSIGLDMDVYQRHVIILEDIIDWAERSASFYPNTNINNPPLKIASLLHAADNRLFN